MLAAASRRLFALRPQQHQHQAIFSIALLSRLLSTSQSFQLDRTFTQRDVDAFVQLTGDSNPIHKSAQPDQENQQQQQQQHPVSTSEVVVPGILLASMFPAIIGSQFPGALYLSQTLKFRRSAAVGSAVCATVRVGKRSGSRVTFDTVCRDAQGHTLIDGTALALISSSTPAEADQT